MKLVHLTANAAFAFVLGDQIISIDGCRFFNTRREAVAAARRVGINVSKNGRASASRL
jgi:hypothetical protein